MTRWLSGILVTICGLLPVTGLGQDSWSQSGFPKTGYIGSPGFDAPPSGNVSAGGYYPHGSVDPYAQLRPGHNGYGESERRLRDLLGAPVSQTWVRFDVLHWTIKGADDSLLGAPVSPDTTGIPFDLTGQDRSRRLQALDRVTGARPQTFAIVPSIGQSEEDAISGFRLSFGIPTEMGDIEANGFVFEEYDQGVQVNPMTDTFGFQNLSLIGAVSLKDNGVITNDTMVLFSEGLAASHRVKIYGFETNMVSHAITPNVGLLIRPIIGVRYLNFEDELDISGTDIRDPINNPTDILNHRINSMSQNHIIGPQLGFRAESTRKRFTLGTDFKFLLGINRVQNQVSTAQIFAIDELPQVDTFETTKFAPIVDFSVYGKLKATQNLSFMISYQVLAGGGFSRSFDSIDYNAPTAISDPPLIRTRNADSSFYAHGLVIGAEFVFP